MVKKKTPWLAIGIVLLVIAIILGIYSVTEQAPTIEGACTNSGGTVRTSLCCLSTSDFPNLCLIGPCGCSPENSHEVKICDCGEGKCWDSERQECVTPPFG